MIIDIRRLQRTITLPDMFLLRHNIDLQTASILHKA